MLSRAKNSSLEKIQVFITFQHYRVTQRLSGRTVLEARPKV